MLILILIILITTIIARRSYTFNLLLFYALPTPRDIQALIYEIEFGKQPLILQFKRHTTKIHHPDFRFEIESNLKSKLNGISLPAPVAARISYALRRRFSNQGF